MYESLFVFDLKDENSIFLGVSDNISNLLPKQDGKSLYIRNTERGSKIVSLSKERLIF